MPSRFLADMGHGGAQYSADDQYDTAAADDEWSDGPGIEVGERVRSHMFGLGTVTDIDGMAVSVEFDSGKTKKLNVEYARLEKAS